MEGIKSYLLHGVYINIHFTNKIIHKISCLSHRALIPSARLRWWKLSALSSSLSLAQAVRAADLAGHSGVSDVGLKGAGGAESLKRPSWRQSELDVQKSYPDYEPQKSFKNGQEVPYGTRGSTR